MQQCNDLLKEALLEVKEEELEKLPAEDEVDYEFSKDFIRWNKKLINKQKRFTSGKTLKRVVAALIALSCVFVIMRETNASKTRVSNITYKYRDKTTIELFIKGSYELPAEAYVAYDLPFIPEGFTTDGSFPYNNRTWRFYKEIDGTETFEFYQYNYLISGNDEENTSIGNNPVEHLDINFIEVIYIEFQGTVRAYWTEHNCVFKLSYPVEWGKEFLEDIVGKLVIDEDYVSKEDIF